jgi:hypothetical protein
LATLSVAVPSGPSTSAGAVDVGKEAVVGIGVEGKAEQVDTQPATTSSQEATMASRTRVISISSRTRPWFVVIRSATADQ